MTNAFGDARFIKIEASEGTIHLVRQDNEDGSDRIYYMRSLDNGMTWGNTSLLSLDVESAHESSMAVHGSSVHVVWSFDKNNNLDLHYRRSTDGGTTWDEIEELVEGPDQYGGGNVAVHESNVHVTWITDKHASDNFEVYYKRSTDNGENWSDDRKMSTHDSFSGMHGMAVEGDEIHLTLRFPVSRSS